MNREEREELLALQARRRAARAKASLAVEVETLPDTNWNYCPACAGELDTGFECLQCGRDWRPWATLYLNMNEIEGEQ